MVVLRVLDKHASVKDEMNGDMSRRLSEGVTCLRKEKSMGKGHARVDSRLTHIPSDPVGLMVNGVQIMSVSGTAFSGRYTKDIQCDAFG